MSEADLTLGAIGNGSFGALVDAQARVVWSCLPAFDGDPAFCALLSPRAHDGGDYAIELEDFAGSEQAYLDNTAILRTVLRDNHGGAVEILDFAPRWRQHDRLYRPVSLIRQVTPLAGSPRIRVRVRPLADWGARVPDTTWGSNHIRWLLPDFTLRMTTDAPVRFVREETPFVLTHPVHLVLGADESLTRGVAGYVREALERTAAYWREWVRNLSIPLDWQEAVIRSAITLKLCQYEDSGAIIAAMTTSIPEAPHTQLHEHEVESLAGYRGMGPVRRGNLAWIQKQHDVYGSVVLASTQLFFDQRLADPGGIDAFARRASSFLKRG